MTDFIINTEQQIRVYVRPKTAGGVPVQIDSITWTPQNGVASVTPDSFDDESYEHSAIVRPIQLGLEQITVVADVDLGEGVTTLEENFTVEVVPAVAVDLDLSGDDPQPLEVPVYTEMLPNNDFSSGWHYAGFIGPNINPGQFIAPWQIDNVYNRGAMHLGGTTAAPLSIPIVQRIPAGTRCKVTVNVNFVSTPIIPDKVLGVTLDGYGEGDPGLHSQVQVIDLASPIDVGTYQVEFTSIAEFNQLNLSVSGIDGQCFISDISLGADVEVAQPK